MIIWAYKTKFKYIYYTAPFKIDNTIKLILKVKNRAGHNFLKTTVFSKGKRLQHFYIQTYNFAPPYIYGFVQLFTITSLKKFLLLKLLSGHYIWLTASYNTRLHQFISNVHPQFYYNAPILLTNLHKPTKIHSISTRFLKIFSCSPGTFSINISKTLLILPSQQKIKICSSMSAIIGQTSMRMRRNCNYQNAGRRRKKGYKSTVKGIVMNAVAHPHGGNSGPARSSRSPWGKHAK